MPSLKEHLSTEKYVWRLRHNNEWNWAFPPGNYMPLVLEFDTPEKAFAHLEQYGWKEYAIEQNWVLCKMKLEPNFDAENIDYLETVLDGKTVV